MSLTNAASEVSELPDDGRDSPRRPGIVKVALGLVVLSSATTPWTAVTLGSLRFSDIFLLLGLATLVLINVDQPVPRLPGWVLLFAVTILFVGLEHAAFPTDGAYMAQREYIFRLTIAHGTSSNGGNLSVMIRFLIAVVGLPMAFVLARRLDHRILLRLAMAYAAGTVVSSLIAFVDSQGLGTVSASLTGFASVAGRAPGLTEHPNYVAMSCVYSLPLLLWQCRAREPRRRALAILGAGGVLLGVYASGSRAGAAAAVVAAGLSFALFARYRRLLPAVALFGGLLLAVLFVAKPSLGAGLLHTLRLTGSSSDTGSDFARSIVNNQGWRDFDHSPILGVGFDVAGEAHIVYLQALAVGGVLLLAAYLVFLAGALWRAARLTAVEALAAPLFVAVLAGALFDAQQDALTQRIVYIPAALVAALRWRRSAASTDRDDPLSDALARTEGGP